MTLERSSTSPVFSTDAAPATLEGLRTWAASMFGRVEQLLREPRPETLTLSLLQPGDAAFERPAEGAIVFAAATATGVGSVQGVYVRTGGAWVQL